MKKLDGHPMLGVAVFDGHGGWQVAEYLREHLVPAVGERIKGMRCKGDPIAVTEALRDTFDDYDARLKFVAGEALSLKFSKPAKVGSCALCVLIDSRHLFVANVGDCKALLVRGAKSVALNAVHNAIQAAEQQRLKHAHPGEDDVYVCKGAAAVGKAGSGEAQMAGACYVKGKLQLTRSFGDFYLKDASYHFDFERNQPFFSGPTTQPYITATPEVSVYPRHPQDQLLVLGSDGLWDYLSNEDVQQLAKPFLDGSAKEGTFQALAERLVEEVLARSAKAHNIEVQELRKLPPGPLRRRIHDDITVVTVKL